MSDTLLCCPAHVQGDTAIVDLKFTEVGSTLPLPGLSADKARFDTDVDPFGLTKVCPCEGGCQQGPA
jgi:hypothetical protein